MKIVQSVTKEIQSIIDKKVDELLYEIIDSVYLGCAENESPNSSDFSEYLQNQLNSAQEYLLIKIKGEQMTPKRLRELISIGFVTAGSVKVANQLYATCDIKQHMIFGTRYRK